MGVNHQITPFFDRVLSGKDPIETAEEVDAHIRPEFENYVIGPTSEPGDARLLQIDGEAAPAFPELAVADVDEGLVMRAWLLLQRHRWHPELNVNNERGFVHPLVQHVLHACISVLRNAGIPTLLPFHDRQRDSGAEPNWSCTLPREAYPSTGKSCLIIEAKQPAPLDDPNSLDTIWPGVKQAIAYMKENGY